MAVSQGRFSSKESAWLLKHFSCSSRFLAQAHFLLGSSTFFSNLSEYGLKHFLKKKSLAQALFQENKLGSSIFLAQADFLLKLIFYLTKALSWAILVNMGQGLKVDWEILVTSVKNQYCIQWPILWMNKIYVYLKSHQHKIFWHIFYTK